MSIARSLVYGVANLLHPRMLWLMLWPMLIALAIWGTVAIALWVRVATLIAGMLQRWLEAAMFFAKFNLGDATLVAAHVLLFLLFVPLVYLTALFILGIFGMQAMVDHVARRSFPDLERRRGGGGRGERVERSGRAFRDARPWHPYPAALAAAAAVAPDPGGDPRLGQSKAPAL